MDCISEQQTFLAGKKEMFIIIIKAHAPMYTYLCCCFIITLLTRKVMGELKSQ